jgi:hypothetical protein
VTEDPSMKDKAGESAQAGKEAASDLASTATEKAQDVVAQAKGQARDLVGEARGQLRSQAGDQQRSAVTNLRSLGDELRSMSQNGDQNGVATHLVDQAADRVHGVAGWLDGREPEDLIDEVRRLARRRPGAFLVGALAAGVIAGRLTRGVIAEHQDDSSGSGAGSDSSPQLGSGGPRPAADAPYAGGVDTGRHTYGEPTTYSGGIGTTNEVGGGLR